MATLREKKYYMARKKDGSELIYTSAEKLLAKAFEYFAWCEDNPWYKKELMRSGDRKGDIVEVPIHRPYTLVGLCVYCGISEATFCNFETNEQFRNVAIHIRDVIRQNQLEGAVTGAYNSNLVARLLGLSDSQDYATLTGHSLTIQVTNPITKLEVENLREALMQVQG